MLLRHVTFITFLVLPIVMSNVFADVIGDDPNDPSTESLNECIKNVVTHYIENYQSENWPGNGNPDDVTDWSPIIQNAINSLDIDRGGVIFFPARKYDLYSPINAFHDIPGEIERIPNLVFRGIGINKAYGNHKYAEKGSLLKGKSAGMTLISCGFTQEGYSLTKGVPIDISGINFVGGEARPTTIHGIKGYWSGKSRIVDCNFKWMDTCINFYSEALNYTGANYSDGCIIQNVNMLQVNMGIAIAGADFTTIEKVQINNDNSDAGNYPINDFFKCGIYLHGANGAFINNLLFDGIESLNSSCIHLEKCSGIKISGTYLETVDNTLFRVGYSNNISIDGSVTKDYYRIALHIDNSYNISLHNFRSFPEHKDSPDRSNPLDADVFIEGWIDRIHGISLQNISLCDPHEDDWDIFRKIKIRKDLVTGGSNPTPNIGCLAQDNRTLQAEDQSGNDYELPFIDLKNDHMKVFVVENDGKVGIGPDSPKAPLHISEGENALLEDGTGYLIIGKESEANLVMDKNEILARNNEGNSNLHLQSKGGNLIVHGSGDEDKEFHVKDDGSVGIGDSTPDSKLDVAGGDIRLSTDGKGIIMKNGSITRRVRLNSTGDGFIFDNP